MTTVQLSFVEAVYTETSAGNAVTGSRYVDPDSFGSAVVSTDSSLSISGSRYVDPDSFGTTNIVLLGAISGSIYVDPDHFWAAIVSDNALPPTWEEHFLGNAWNTIQDQINAGYDFFIEPVDHVNPSYFQQEIDVGTTLANCTISVQPTIQILDGNPALQIDIGYKENPGDNWTLVSNTLQTFATNVRYVRVTANLVADSGDDLLVMDSLVVDLGLKLINDSGGGMAVSTDPTGTRVNFNKTFHDINSITVTPLGTSARLAVYDFLDAPNPTGFDVYLFGTNGSRVSGDFSWTARGY